MLRSVPPADRQQNWPRGRRSESGRINAPPRATCFARSIPSSRRLQDVSCIEKPIENWSREEQAVETIQYAAMPGQNRRGIFHTRATLQDRFCQVANLTRDCSRCTHASHPQPWFPQQKSSNDSGNEATDEAGDRTFNRLLGTDLRCKCMTSESTANIIRDAIADPDDAKQKQHQFARHHDEETQCKRAVRYAGETHSNASQNPVDGFAENHHRH